MIRQQAARPLAQAGLALGLLCSSTTACTDAELYGPGGALGEADRVALSGRVCAADSLATELPTRIVVVADQAAGPLYDTFDPAGSRIELLNAFFRSQLNNDQTSLALVGFGGTSQILAPSEGNFSRNPGELGAAVSQLALAQSCLDNGSCRNYLEGLRSARALIEGELAQTDAGTRALTQYIVLLVVAGPQDPQLDARRCCDADDSACLDQEATPSAACQSQIEQSDVASLRDAVLDAGALGFQLHVVHLAADEDAAVNETLQDGLQRMAMAGTGQYQRFNAAAGFAAAAFDVLDARNELRAKSLIVANLNAKITSSGPQPDSDADGLSDEEEANLGTNPRERDTDEDGLSDLVETVIDFDPLVANTVASCAGLDIFGDDDLDGLQNCEESLLGSEPTLVDSDGDGLPDLLELYGFTDYVQADGEQDADGDGLTNADELQARTDPRSTDPVSQRNYSYRYDVADEGVSEELYAPVFVDLTGVAVVGARSGSTPGLGALQYRAADQALRWQDPGDNAWGPYVTVAAGGEFELPSASFAVEQGDAGRAITVAVEPIDLPPADLVQQTQLLYQRRHCLSYTVRNVRLMATTGVRDDGRDEGLNRVVLFFAESATERAFVPGPFRMAEVPITYRPPSFREPGTAVVEVLDGDFVRP